MSLSVVFSESHYRVMRLLADGHFHSGQALGQSLHTSKANVWKIIQQIRAQDVVIEALPKKGYRLPEPMILLDAALIRSGLKTHAQPYASTLRLLPTVDSTNRYAMNWSREHPEQRMVCLAEHQSEGRGRLGKRWHSPFGQHLYLTLLDWLQPAQLAFSSIGLCVSIGVANALRQYLNSDGLKIKWPNDVLFQGKKLAGILIESSTEANQSIPLVVGVGVNVHAVDDMDPVDQPWIDLARAAGHSIDRNHLASEVINHIAQVIYLYQKEGFSGLIDQWKSYDALLHQPICLVQGNDKVEGVALGVNDKGELIVQQADERMVYASYGVAHTVREVPSCRRTVASSE